MATFKSEEIRALEEGGNGVALACFLAKWTPRDAPKPVDRNVAKIRDWIDLVFVKRRYYSKDVVHVPPVSRTQSTSSARSTASRENDASLKIPAGVASNGPMSQGPSETARTTSEAGSLIDLELSPGPAAPTVVNPPAPAAMPAHNGWDTFGDVGGGSSAVAPATAAAQPQEQGWSTFEEPAASTSTPVVSTSSGTTGGFQGWQAFDTAQPSTPPASAAVEPPSSRGPVMKELPSDLFSELVVPQPTTQQPMPGALPYGQVGAAGVPVHPGFAPGMVAYPLQPGPVQPGYLSLDQQYFLSSPGVAASPAQQQAAIAQGPGSSPAAAAPQQAPPPETDVFSSLVPGLRSSLFTAQPSPPTTAGAAASFNGGAPAFLPQYGASQQSAHFPPYGATQQYGQPAVAQSNGAFQGPGQVAAHMPASFVGGLPGHTKFGAPPESRPPKRAGGNPFA